MPLRAFKKTATPELAKLEDNVANVLEPVLNAAILDGKLVENVNLNTAASVQHKLGRVPRGWIVVDRNANAQVWSTAKDKNFLTLSSSGAVVVTIWVF